MIKQFLSYRKWVINWNWYLWKEIPNDYCIFFRFIFNDLIRYVYQQLFLYKNLEKGYYKVLEENRILKDKLDKYLKI